MNPTRLWLAATLCFAHFAKAADPVLPDTSDAERGLDLAGVKLDLLYEADFTQPQRIVLETDLFEGESRVREPADADWVLEGKAAARVEGGGLRLVNEGGHLVCWSTRSFPADLLLEFVVTPADPDNGLNIVFLAAKGREGGGIFDLAQPFRGGDFKTYHSGGLDCYHASYWATDAKGGARGTAHIRKNHGFHLVSQGRDFITGSPPGPHRVRVLKRGAFLAVEVDGKVAVNWTDDGQTFGPVLGGGRIGLRQMAHSRESSYSRFKVWSVADATSEKSATSNLPEVRRIPLILTEGGTPEELLIFDGKGMVIDLGVDITDEEWVKNGDVWTTRGPFPERPPVADEQRAGLFIDEVPVRISRNRAAERASGEAGKIIYTAPEALQPGQMAWTAEGALYFRWPKEKAPGAGRVIRPPAKLESCVVIACSHLTVRNITAKHAANDGFNIHGHRVGIRLENVKAFSNGDEGISAHETVQMDVFDSEIAWNGSSAGGVADVNDSVTTYTNCELHHNVNAAFFFDGKHHRVTNCLIHHQNKDIVIRGDAMVEQSGNVWRKE